MTSRIEQLMKLCMQEEASEAERNELLSLLQATENEGEAKSLIYAALEGGDGLDMSGSVSAAVLEAIFQADAGRQGEVDKVSGREGEVDRKKERVVFFRRMAYAAAVVLVVAMGMVVALVKRKPAPTVVTVQKQDIVKDIPPGGNKAILTLADGATISLDDAKKGDIARDGNAQIVKAGNGGTLIYHAVAGNQQAVAYNTITTPRGG